MIKGEFLKEIKKKLESANNLAFLFDNDGDGICSAAILKKNIEKGDCYPLRSLNKINSKIEKRIIRNSPNYLIILDKPFNNEKFFKKIKERGIEIILIDHHEIKDKKDYDLILNNFPSSEPTSYLTQKIFNSKETLLLSLIGCICDNYKPSFYEEISKSYPELMPKKENASEIFYSTEIGKACRIISYSLKSSDKTVERILNFLTKIKSPYDILMENSENNFLHQKYKEIEKIIEKNLKRVKKIGKLVLLEYGGNTSISSEIANKISYIYKNSFVIVCFRSERTMNISIRGKNAKKITEEITRKIKESSGGGHEEACGLRIPSTEYEKFIKEILTILRIKKGEENGET